MALAWVNKAGRSVTNLSWNPPKCGLFPYTPASFPATKTSRKVEKASSSSSRPKSRSVGQLVALGCSLCTYRTAETFVDAFKGTLSLGEHYSELTKAIEGHYKYPVSVALTAEPPIEAVLTTSHLRIVIALRQDARLCR